MHRLIGDDSHRSATQPGKADDYILGIVVMRLQNHAIIHNGADNLPHIIDLARVIWNYGIESGKHTIWVITGLHDRGILHIVGRQVA